MNFLRPSSTAAQAPSASDPPPSPGAHSSASTTTNLDPASYTLEPGPTAPIDHESWFAQAHDTISKSVSQSLQTLQLWEQLRLRHSQLQAEAQHLVATRDHLASYARYLDDERARLDSWAKQLDRHDRRRAKAQDRFDEARRRWCLAAGLDPETTFAVDGLTDSEAEEEDGAGESTTASQTQQSKRERAAGFMGSALKTAISITGATSTLSKLDKAYHVRDRVTGVPLLGSLVQSALVEESGEDREDDQEDDEEDDVCLPSHVIPSSAEDSYSQRRRNGSSASPSPNRVNRRQSLRQQSRGSSSGRRMSAAGAANAKECNRTDSGSSCSSDSNSDLCTSGSESDNESECSNPRVPEINITHPSPIAASQSLHSTTTTVAPATTTATGLVGGLLRRAASVANLGRVTSLAATSQSEGATNNNKTLRPAASQPHLRNAAAARSVVSTSSGSSNGSSSDQTQRPAANGSIPGSPQTSPDVHHLRRSASMTPKPRAQGRPTSMIGTAPTLAPPLAPAHAQGAPPVVVLPAPTQMPYYAHPPPQLVHQQSMPNLAMHASSPRLGVDDLGTVLSAVSTVASVAQSVGGAGAAGAVKSVGGYVLGKVLSQGN